MKNKIGIVTIVHGENYGNRLQNYALQKVIEDMGYEACTFRRNIYRNVLSQVKNELKQRIVTNYHVRERRKRFQAFNQDYIHFSNEVLYIRKTWKKNDYSNYHAFICGSDQIWNPNWSTNGDADFLTFAPMGKRIAYAASFGVEKIEKKDELRYQKNLSGLDYISVREGVGKEIVQQLTGRDVSVVADPTMLVKSNEWESIEKRPEIMPNNRYVFCYFLAGIDPLVQQRIKEYAIKNRQEIIWFDNPENPDSFSNGPCEFLYCIHHASHIFTDSFHCTVFSIIFEKQFDAFPRYIAGSKMNDRIATLLLNCNIENRFDRGVIDDEQIDYGVVKNQVMAIVSESKGFLEKSLANIGKNRFRERTDNNEK